MKYEKEQLTLESGIKKDWIITNGIGGYSSSTILGINTSFLLQKYSINSLTSSASA